MLGNNNIKKWIIVVIIMLIFCMTLMGCSQKRELKEYSVNSAERDGEYDFIYDELKHRIIVCSPDRTDDNTAVIVMLHGYGGTASEFKQETVMEADAVPRNYIVVYVTGAVDRNDPTSAYGWNASWNSKLQESEKDDVGMLSALVSYIQTEYGLKSDKAFVAGFSNGGFMTFRLAIEAGDVFDACASVGGKMSNEMWEYCSNSKPKTAGFLQINGTADNVVPMNLNGSVNRAKDPAIEEVMAYFAEINKCKNMEKLQMSDKSTLLKYIGRTDKEIWEVIIEEGGHNWPDKEFAGFDTNELILDFFDMYR